MRRFGGSVVTSRASTVRVSIPASSPPRSTARPGRTISTTCVGTGSAISLRHMPCQASRGFLGVTSRVISSPWFTIADPSPSPSPRTRGEGTGKSVRLPTSPGSRGEGIGAAEPRLPISCTRGEGTGNRGPGAPVLAGKLGAPVPSPRVRAGRGLGRGAGGSSTGKPCQGSDTCTGFGGAGAAASSARTFFALGSGCSASPSSSSPRSAARIRSTSTCFSRPSAEIPTAKQIDFSVSRESSARIFSKIPRFLLPATTSIISSSRMPVVTSSSSALPTSNNSTRVSAPRAFLLNVMLFSGGPHERTPRHDTPPTDTDEGVRRDETGRRRSPGRSLASPEPIGPEGRSWTKRLPIESVAR